MLRLLELLEQRGIGALVVTKMENVRYLCGFTGSSAVALVTPKRRLLFTDGRYSEQAADECPSWELVVCHGDSLEEIARSIPKGATVGFEETASYSFYRKLEGSLSPGSGTEPVSGVVEELRVRKDPEEIMAISQALKCASLGFKAVAPLIAPGAVENDIAARLDYEMRKAGAHGPAFDTVVAGGPRSSRPHARSTDLPLQEGYTVVVDFGAQLDGYRSDITRTLLLGDNQRGKALLEAVGSAMESALEKLEPGVPACEVDAAARLYLDKLGLAPMFVHSLGHGIGLETHERPTLSERSEDKLEPGMVFTVEPGLYLEGTMGIRLEEMVLMTEEGARVLSSAV